MVRRSDDDIARAQNLWPQDAIFASRAAELETNIQRALQVNDARAIAERVFREEGGRIIASLIRISGSFDLAEEAMQEAFTSALLNWPERGIPEKPSAWIMAVAHRKWIDFVRRRSTQNEKQDALQYEIERTASEEDVSAEEMSATYPDDRLR